MLRYFLGVYLYAARNELGFFLGGGVQFVRQLNNLRQLRYLSPATIYADFDTFFQSNWATICEINSDAIVTGARICRQY